MATRSPGATVVTPAPTRSTTPAPSWPSTAGSGTGYHWSRMIRSVWQMPAAATRTSTSPARGSSSSSGWIAYGAPLVSVTAARISMRGKLPGMPHTLALTFDNLGGAAERARGGEPERPHPSVETVLPWLLALLEKLRLTATFCVEGVNTEEHPDAVRAIAAAGHEIALHGWEHERFDAAELARAREAFAALDIHPTGYRPPGGELPPDGLRVLADLGVRW